MHSGSRIRGVQANAGPGFRVIGDLGAPIDVYGLVGFASCDHEDAARAEERSQANAEGEIGILFQLSAGKMAAEVVAAVGRVKDNPESGWGDRSSGRNRRLGGLAGWRRRRLGSWGGWRRL